MKKLILLVSLLSVLCFSCKNKTAQTDNEQTVAEVNPADERALGFWVGDFEAEEYKKGSEFVSTNKLNITIKKFVGDEVFAQSVVAGNVRPLKGKVIRSKGVYAFVLSEPGDDKFDGEFEFEIIDTVLVGTWKSFDKTLAVTKRNFKLTKKKFTYDASLMLPERDYMDQYSGKEKQVTDTIDGESETYTNQYYRAASESVYTINSSMHTFTEQELKNYKKLDLEILRNTIFARHGYSFKKKGYRQFFDDVDWYVPVTANVDGELTPLEKANIKLFQRFEKYATDNYDTFGR